MAEDTSMAGLRPLWQSSFCVQGLKDYSNGSLRRNYSHFFSAGENNLIIIYLFSGMKCELRLWELLVWASSATKSPQKVRNPQTTPLDPSMTAIRNPIWKEDILSTDCFFNQTPPLTAILVPHQQTRGLWKGPIIVGDTRNFRLSSWVRFVSPLILAALWIECVRVVWGAVALRSHNSTVPWHFPPCFICFCILLLFVFCLFL